MKIKYQWKTLSIPFIITDPRGIKLLKIFIKKQKKFENKLQKQMMDSFMKDSKQ